MTVSLVSLDWQNNQTNRSVDDPAISGNGKVVIFESSAQLAPQPTNGVGQVYYRLLRNR